MAGKPWFIYNWDIAGITNENKSFKPLSLILALTCTEQIQKWHRRTKKGSIPMMTLRRIKLTSAKSNKSNIHESKIVPADPEKSKFNRDVLKMKTEIKE